MNELVPRYLEGMPTVADYRYINSSRIHGYKGPSQFAILFSPQETFSLIWSNANTYFLYDSEQDYSETETRKVHFIYDGWAYLTGYRHRVGEAGRIQ